MTSTDSITIDRKLLTRIFSKVKVSTEHFYNGVPCWEWTDYLTNHGYGRPHWFGRNILAHRLLYELFVEPIPPGLEPDHLCRVRHCVNPAHIELVTPRINKLRGVSPVAINAAKTHCDQGHELVPTKRGSRGCPTCTKAYQAQYRERLRSLPDDNPEKIRQRESFRKSSEKRKADPTKQESIRAAWAKSREAFRQLPYDHPRRVQQRERDRLRSRQRRARKKMDNISHA